MDHLAQQPLTMCTSKVTLAVGTTTTLSNTGTILFCIKGKAYSKSAMTNAATPTTDAVTGIAFVGVAVNKASVFTICLDKDGNLKAVQGKVTDLDASGNYIVKPENGPVPGNLCPIGRIYVKVGSTGSTWTFGSSNFAGPPTGVTFTIEDLMSVPDRP